MSAHTVMTHALNQGEHTCGAACACTLTPWERDLVAFARGVSLVKATDAAPVAPRTVVSATAMVDVGESAWWGVPAYVVRGWITVRLRKGHYAQASWLSALLHSA